MKLTKQGYDAVERAELNDEGKDLPFSESPYKKAYSYRELTRQIKHLKNASRSEYVPLPLRKQINTLVLFFNRRGAEYTSLTK